MSTSPVGVAIKASALHSTRCCCECHPLQLVLLSKLVPYIQHVADVDVNLSCVWLVSLLGSYIAQFAAMEIIAIGIWLLVAYTNHLQL